MTDARGTPASDTTADAVADIVRAGDRDRWLAGLFAPPTERTALYALYAFNFEVARVRELVSDPLPGEVRLQWWRDVLNGEARGEVLAHPVARALLEAVERYRLPRAALVALVDARTFDLYDDPMPTLNDLEGYCGETSSALIQLGAIVCADGMDPGTHDAAGHAGVAYALTGLLRALPFHARRGQCFLPLDVMARHGATRDDVTGGQATPAVQSVLAEMRSHARRHLAEARRLMPTVPVVCRPAFLPVALVESYIDALDGLSDPFGTVADIAPWRRLWVLWRQSRRRSF